MSEYIQIGKIVNTHGIKGDLKVIPLTNDMTRYEKLESVYIENEKKSFEIEHVWYKKNFVMLKLKGFNDINEVLKFKDKFVLIDKSSSIELPEDTYFIHEIIGLRVFTLDGDELGEITQVLQPGSNDVYVVKNGKREFMIPAVKEMVKEINIELGKVTIDPIEGLIE